MRDSLPLKCEVIKGVIRISIGSKTLGFAAEHHDTFYDGEADTWLLTVTRPAKFAKAVMEEINAEDETGCTLLTTMLDQAIFRAVENGCEGIVVREERP